MRLLTPIYVTFPIRFCPDGNGDRVLQSEMDIELSKIEYIRGVSLDGSEIDGTEIGLSCGMVCITPKELKSVRRIISANNERRFQRYQLMIQN